MSHTLDRQSVEFVGFPIETSPVDPATLTHEVAVVAEFEELPTNWVTAPYVDERVRMLIRASVDAPAAPLADFTLAPGRWRVWWRAASNPEYPVRRVGIISVV